MATEEQRYLALRMTQEQLKADIAPLEAANVHREMAMIYSRRLTASGLDQPARATRSTIAD